MAAKTPDTKEQERAEQIIRRFDTLKSDRGTLDSHLQEVAERVIPRKSYVTVKRQEGQKTITFNTELFDATSAFANLDMAAGLVSHLFSGRWFGIRATNKEIQELPAVRESLARLTNLLLEELAASNFNNIISEVMTDMGWAGQACLEPMEGKKTTLNFRDYHISEFYIAENSDKLVDTVYYKFEYTARQAKQEWGKDNLSKCILDALDSTKKEDLDKKFEFIQELRPREDFDNFPAVATRRPIASTFVCVKDKAIIFEDGYYEMPKLTPRWSKNSNEVNGRSPAMFALPWIKLLNKVMKTSIQAEEMGLRPVTLTPDDGFIGPIRSVPGAIWHYRATYAANPNAIRQLDARKQSSTKDIMLFIEWIEKNIKKAFFNDLFVMLTEIEGQKTAFEISERIQEKHARAVMPIGRLHSELANGFITRCVGILGRAGKLRNILVPELIGQPYEIQYISKLALAIKMIEVQSITATMDVIKPIGERNPMIFDNFDDDEVTRGVAERMGMPPDMMRTIPDRDEIREQREADLEAQQAAELAIEAAKAAPGISKEVEDGSVLAGIGELAEEAT